MPLFKRKSVKKAPPSPHRHEEHMSNGAASNPPKGVASVDAQGGWHEGPYQSRPKSLLLPLNVQDEDTGDLGAVALKAETPLQTNSRLSKTLSEILHDKDALPHLIKFLYARGGEYFIKFWLDAESFQATAWTRIRTHSQNELRKSSVRSRKRTDSSKSENEETEKRKIGNVPNDRIDDSVFGQSEGHDLSRLHHSTSCINSADVADSYEATAGSFLKAASPLHTSSHPSCDSRLHMTAQNPSSDSLPSNSATCSLHAKPVQNDNKLDSNPKANNNNNTPCDSGGEGLSSRDYADPAGTGGRRIAEVTREEAITDKLIKSIERDAVMIFTKYISQDAVHPIGISDELRNETIRKICGEDRQVDPQCFMACQDHVVAVIQKDYYDEFLRSEYHCRHQIDILTQTGSQVYLADILYNESAFFYFMEFMEQEGASCLLQCWMAMDNFQQHLISQRGCVNTDEAQSDAMVLYDKYFSMQALQPVGFDDKIRFEVEMNICREGGPLPDCFSGPMKIVLKSLEKLYFVNFLTSDIYFRYLSELINTVHNQDIPMSARRKRTGSDASSEHSVDSQSTGSGSVKNTLLAASAPQPHNLKKVLNSLHDDMRIENALLNPEALWRRNQAGMSLGKVNSLGQFVSEFDPEPDHEKKKKAATFFKKKKEKEQSQEEMAIQIAQMIINDVTSTTAATKELTSSLFEPPPS